ncbi:hypothetical protein V8C37DRAFT_26580 [Trichoderma ceciliae]
MLPRPSSETAKLRTSCQACALVKVKCTKEKPTCSRCKNRGIACQYFVVKRPGRRRQTIDVGAVATNSTTLTATDSGDGCVGSAMQQPSRTSLSPNPSFQDGSSSMVDMRGTAPMSTSLTSVASHTGVNMMTSSTSCLDHPVLSRSFMSNSLADDDMATIDPLSIFSAFEETSGSLSADLVDVGSEMDGLDFLRTSGVSNRIHSSPRDIASLLMPVEDMTELTTVSDPIRAADTSMCGCSCSSSSSSRSGLSSSFFSSAGQMATSLAAMSTRRTRPATASDTLTCQCLDRALHLLKKVSGSSSLSSSSHSSSSSQSSCAVTRVSSASPDENQSSAAFGVIETQSRWFQVALTENKQCLGAMDNILMCSGTDEDRMLLLVLCMALLKILDRYSNVAWSRLPPSRTRNRGTVELGVNMGDHMGTEAGMLASSMSRSTSILSDQDQMLNVRRKRLATGFDIGPSQHSDDDDSGRATAQLVLGELHRVQRVVNQLLPKLKGPNSYDTDQESQQVRGWCNQQQTATLPMDEGADLGQASPFSASTLEQMAGDVRKSLSNLSASIIHRLRQS